MEETGRRDAYAQRLRDAGYEVEVGSPAPSNIEAIGDPWIAHVVVNPPVITVQVLQIE